jgi:hypothetical protein
MVCSVGAQYNPREGIIRRQRAELVGGLGGYERRGRLGRLARLTCLTKHGGMSL